MKPTGAFVGFRVLEVPLGLIRDMVANGQCGEGAKKLVADTFFYDDLVGVAVNECDGSLTIMRDAQGQPKKLETKKE